MSGLNRDDIIRMAKEAGGDDWGIFRDFMPEIERFAALVAAAERERIAKQFDSGVVNVRARGQSKPEQLYRPFGLALEANLKEKNT